MRLLSLLVLTCIVLLGISFAVLNGEIVTLHYYIGVMKLPLSVVILGSLVAGIVIGLVAYFPMVLRLKMELRGLSRERS